MPVLDQLILKEILYTDQRCAAREPNTLQTLWVVIGREDMYCVHVGRDDFQWQLMAIWDQLMKCASIRFSAEEQSWDKYHGRQRPPDLLLAYSIYYAIIGTVWSQVLQPHARILHYLIYIDLHTISYHTYIPLPYQCTWCLCIYYWGSNVCINSFTNWRCK